MLPDWLGALPSVPWPLSAVAPPSVFLMLLPEQEKVGWKVGDVNGTLLLEVCRWGARSLPHQQPLRIPSRAPGTNRSAHAGV